MICHKQDGTGFPPDLPPLKDNNSIQHNYPGNIIKIILNVGSAPITQKNSQPYVMPGFKDQMNDNEIASVISYIRSAWGNNASSISPKEVTKYRNTH